MQRDDTACAESIGMLGRAQVGVEYHRLCRGRVYEADVAGRTRVGRLVSTTLRFQQVGLRAIAEYDIRRGRACHRDDREWMEDLDLD